MMRKSAVLLAGCLLLSACGTIRFTHDVSETAQPVPPQNGRWHHTTIDGMIEITPPLNLYKECKGKAWQEVKVEYNMSNGTAALLVAGTITALIPALEVVSLWTPWTVETTCTK